MAETKYINTGGAAFPRPASEYTKNGTLADGNHAIDAEDGMTLRDYFAAKAMQGELSTMVATPDNSGAGLPLDVSDSNLSTCAHHWYRIADAMLAARKT